MRSLRLAALAAACLPTPLLAQSASTVAAARAADPLDAALAGIAARAPGQVGIAVIDPVSGRRWSVDGVTPRPLASVVKLAVAAKWLADVDAGRRRLDTMIAVREPLRLGGDGIGRMIHPGIVLSAANLIELMITLSDNTATDVLIEEMGGPPAIQRWLTAEGITDFRIDRPIDKLILDEVGLVELPGKTAAETLWAVEEPEDQAAAHARFVADPRDTASADGVARLLQRIDGGTLLKPDSRAFMLAALGRTRTGGDRLKARLPEGVVLAHKTGTLAMVSNDAGIMTGPDGRRLIVAVMVTGPAEPAARAEIIADVGKAAWDLAPRP